MMDNRAGVFMANPEMVSRHDKSRLRCAAREKLPSTIAAAARTARKQPQAHP
jgi:hypothetical protein